MDGSNHSICSAVISPSRPNVVEYHGIPAYGYGPCGVSVDSMQRSAVDRRTISLKIGFDVATSAARRLARLCCRYTARTPRVKPIVCGSFGLPQVTQQKSGLASLGAR